MEVAEMDEQRQVVIVTGASRGIGEATARLFGERGWAVVLAARSEEDISRISGEIEASGGQALAVTADVTEKQDVNDLAARALEAFGRIDAVVNNAGRGIFGTVASLDVEDLESVFRLNVFAPVAMMGAVVPVMRRGGGGVIVNVSSQAENFAPPLLGAYSASKIALSYLSDAARIELAHANVAVTNVLPGLTNTGFGGSTVRSGSTDDFILPDNLIEGPGGGASPRKVAETIWAAAHERPRQKSVSLGDGVGGRLARTAPGSVNRLLTFALNRYVPRHGHPAASPRRDLATVGLASGGALAALIAAGRLAKR